MMLPDVGLSSPANKPSKVDLPLPETPRMETVSACLTTKLTSFNMLIGPSAKGIRLVMCFASTIFIKLQQSLKSFLMLIVLCLALFANAQSFAQSNILILGDSLSTGYKMKPNESWVALISQTLEQCQSQYEVINLSTAGDTTRNGLQKLPLALEKDPAVVVIELGGNDGLRGLPLIHIRKNIEKLIKMSLEKDAKVLLLGMKLPPNYGKQYTEQFHDIYVAMSKEYDLAFIDFILEDFALNSDYMNSDGIHPTAKAQPLIAEQIWSKLITLLSSNIKDKCNFN